MLVKMCWPLVFSASSLQMNIWITPWGSHQQTIIEKKAYVKQNELTDLENETKTTMLQVCPLISVRQLIAECPRITFWA